MTRARKPMLNELVILTLLGEIGMAKDSKSKKAVSVVMKKDKTCKKCVRYAGEGDGADQVGSSFYLQNPSFDDLGKPDKIKVSIEASD